MPKVRTPWERRVQSSPKKPVNGVANGQLDDIGSARTGASATAGQYDDPTKEPVWLSKADKQGLEKKLNAVPHSTTGKRTELVPIWTLEDADGQSNGIVGESTETQGRFRKYAEQGRFTIAQSNDSALAIITLCFMERNGWAAGDYVVEGLC
jgi:hypothetical protein